MPERSPEVPSPYAPPSAGGATPARAMAPGLRMAVAFLVRRVVVVVVLPVLFGALAGLWRIADPERVSDWLPLAVPLGMALLWMPTTIVQLWTTFLAPRTDPQGIVLASGLRFDRTQLYWQVRAQLVEQWLSAALLVALGAALANLASGLAALSVVAFGVAVWSVYNAQTGLHVSEALIAHASRQPEIVVEQAGIILRRPLIRRDVRDVARVMLAQGRLRLGDPDGALAALVDVRRRDRVGADHLEAQIRIGRGELDLARQVLRRGATGGRLGMESLAGLLSLHDGHPEALLARAREWGPLRDALPADIAAGLWLWEAAAHAQLGDRESARAALAKSGVALAERRWMAKVWPKIWDVLEPLGG